MLESGPRYNPHEDYRLDTPDWERQRFAVKRNAHSEAHDFGPLQPLDARYSGLRSWNSVSGKLNKGDTRHGWRYHYVRGVGGSTLHFSGEAQRLHQDAFRIRSLTGKGADWPITYAELEPHYVTAEKLVGVAGPEGLQGRWRSEPYPLPPHACSYASSFVKAAGERLGQRWVPNSQAILSRVYDGRPSCNHCGQCKRGCPLTDKGSVDVTFISKALATGNLTLETDTLVLRVLVEGRDRVKAVECIGPNAERKEIVTRVLAVACGAVETPRLLLNSAAASCPDGLANESGLLGRNLMTSHDWSSTGIHPERIASYRGHPSDIICWDYNAPTASAAFVGGTRFFTAVADGDLQGPINYAQRIVPGWGREHKQRMRERFGRALTVAGVGESLPNAQTFVALSPERQDDHGLPIARIHSYLDEDALARLQFMAATCRRVLEETGITELVEEYGSYDFFSATHVFGTTRMGTDPERSVVDPAQRSHRWKNLYVTDASVFPSSGGGESPSLSIEALSIRAGDLIRSALARREL